MHYQTCLRINREGRDFIPFLYSSASPPACSADALRQFLIPVRRLLENHSALCWDTAPRSRPLPPGRWGRTSLPADQRAVSTRHLKKQIPPLTTAPGQTEICLPALTLSWQKPFPYFGERETARQLAVPSELPLTSFLGLS